MTKTIGYKAMNLDMTCRVFQFEVGKTYTVDNDKPLKLCTNSGFHFCLNLEDVFNYYDYDECRLFEVETDSEVLTEGDKSITKTITIKRELTQEDFNKYEFKDNIHTVYFKDFSDKELLNFKNDKKWLVRKAVINKMTDLDLMCKTFKDDNDNYVRRCVIEKMTDLDLMFNTFKDDESWCVRVAVVNKMTDLDLMYNMFKNDEDLFVRLSVSDKMKNNK